MLDRLAQLTGPHPDVFSALGYAHRQSSEFESARIHYERALELDPWHRGANEYLGEMWVELGRIDAATARLATLRKACPFGCAEYRDLERVLEAALVASR